MSTREEDEPIMISGMRRWPTGSVRHDPGGGIGATGTSPAGFVREYDRAIVAAEERGAEQFAARLAETVIAELAERHSTKLKQNPAWSLKDERAAFLADQDYEVPQYIERPMAERLGDVCMTVDHHQDGERFIRALSYAEVGEAVRAASSKLLGGAS